MLFSGYETYIKPAEPIFFDHSGKLLGISMMAVEKGGEERRKATPFPEISATLR
jgi:hypothetical protein